MARAIGVPLALERDSEPMRRDQDALFPGASLTHPVAVDPSYEASALMQAHLTRTPRAVLPMV